MFWTGYQRILALIMVVSGSLNTLSTKWADRLYSVNSIGEIRPFDHPFMQTCAMFVGEMLCIYVYMGLWLYRRYRSRSTQNAITRNGAASVRFNPLIFYLPALCDMVATSLMYIGLSLTYASSFQMLRGAVIVFTGLFSRFMLGRRLNYIRWSGIGLIIAGLIVVGLSDFLSPGRASQIYTHNADYVIFGDMLIVIAQLIVALQMVVEERFVSGQGIDPLLGVGCEGIFGFTTIFIGLFAMYHIRVSSTFSQLPFNRLEDPIDGLVQLSNNWQLCLAFVGMIISIAFFNFAGLSITKEMSATTRMVLDSVRTLFIYMFSLVVHWEDFQYLQPIGFIMLICGMFVYNDVIITPFLRSYGCCRIPMEDEPFARVALIDDHTTGDNNSV